MNAIDTNVLVYALDRDEPVKRTKARQLVRQLSTPPVTTIFLWQAAGELLRQLRTWEFQGRVTRPHTRRYLRSFRQFFQLVLPTPQVLDQALDLSEQFSLSHWDSMMLGACLEAGVDTLYTEDMGAPITYASVRLINPFV
jgi:predicted nucleic acid-binding protein